METREKNKIALKPESTELVERSRALRRLSAKTSKKLRKVLREGEKFLHDAQSGDDTEKQAK